MRFRVRVFIGRKRKGLVIKGEDWLRGDCVGDFF